MRRVNIRLTISVLIIIINNISSSQQSDCSIITKSMWGGKPNNEVDYIIIPVRNVIISHTVTGECSDISSCAETVKSIQNMHQDTLRFHDIGYNFIIGGDGNVYEGVGWHKVGAHAFGWNRSSIGISFIGNFKNKLPSSTALNALRNLLNCGVNAGELAINYRLYAHRQVSKTESPGRALYEELTTWPHFSEVVVQ